MQLNLRWNFCLRCWCVLYSLLSGLLAPLYHHKHDALSASHHCHIHLIYSHSLFTFSFPACIRTEGSFPSALTHFSHFMCFLEPDCPETVNIGCCHISHPSARCPSSLQIHCLCSWTCQKHNGPYWCFQRRGSKKLDLRLLSLSFSPIIHLSIISLFSPSCCICLNLKLLFCTLFFPPCFQIFPAWMQRVKLNRGAILYPWLRGYITTFM